MSKRQRFTREFKLEAVRLREAGFVSLILGVGAALFLLGWRVPSAIAGAAFHL